MDPEIGRTGIGLTIALIALGILLYTTIREAVLDRSSSADRQKYYTAESETMQRNWLEDLRKIHRTGRLFVIPVEASNANSMRRYEKRAPLDVKIHRFRARNANGSDVREINAIEFSTAEALEKFEERIVVKGLRPNAAAEILE